MIYEESGKHKVAINHVLRALEIEPLNPEFWFMLGDLQLDIGAMEEAQSSYAKVAELDPGNIEIWLEYSHSFALDFNFNKALELIDKGLTVQPNNVDFTYRKFCYLYKFKKFKEAYIVLEEALIADFDKHMEIFNYMKELKNDDNLFKIIELFNPEN
jgi:tetratricopeptide (TPR) repeat protein